MFLLLLFHFVYFQAAFCNEDEHSYAPLVGLSHNLSADGVRVMDDKTLVIKNLHYDGLSPDAHFWAGTGPEPDAAGFVVPDENGSVEKLKSYSGATLMLRVPDHVDAYDLDWLSVWCVLDGENIGYAMLRQPNNFQVYRPNTTPPPKPPLKIAAPLSTLAHGVSSGPVIVLDEETLFVPNFRYDGEGPDAYFWVGKNPGPSEHGVPVSYGVPGEKLGAYDGVNVTLKLPEGITVRDIDWLSVWCKKFKHDFGHVKLHEEEEVKVPIFPSRFGETERVLPEFSRLAHGLRSGNITIINSTSFFIPDLFYDGKGPDAHFWVGNGSEPSENGVAVPYKNYEATLPEFKGENVTITLPGSLTVDDIEWLGVWCIQFKHNFGFVRLKETVKRRHPIKTVAEFSRLAHGLSSGNISILDEKTIFIPDLRYDGKGPDAHFWIGNGTALSGEGIRVPYKNFDKTLPAFNGEDVTLTLPDGYTVDNIDWIGLWCIQFKSNFGFTLLHPKVEPLYVRLEPFKQLAHGLRSGPIFIINERTLFVTNLHYDGKGPDAYFWVGKGSQGPSPAGMKIANEHNSTNVLGEYVGEDVYLRLPMEVTVHDIDYVGVFCVKFKHNFGFTDIPKNLGERVDPDSNYYERDFNGNYIARIPKCCPAGEMKSRKGCVRKTVEVAPIDIYEGNMTKFDDEATKNVTYEPYLYSPNCQFGMYYLDPEMDKSYLLTAGILVVEGENEITKDKFCIDIQYNEANGWHHTPFLCFPDDSVPEALNKVYAGCIYISAIFLMITTFIFIWYKKARDMRGFNVIGYSVTMAISFVCLATARLLHVTEGACIYFGYAYQFFLLSSFTWLFCLTYETHHRIKWYNAEYSKGRFYKYAAVGFGVPILAMTLSFFVNDKIPNKFNRSVLLHDACWFRSDKKIIFYYVPILVSILINTAYNGWTWMLLKRNDKRVHDTYWPLQAQDLKNVFRSCYMLLIVMTICWISEILSYFFDDMRNGFWIAIDIIDSLQGFFVFLIFILHNPVNNILKDLWKHRHRQENILRYDAETEKLHMTPRPPTVHLESLTKIKHADSVENLTS